jgi:hypothetical protein
MPLGASFNTKGRNFGLVVGLGIFVIYYSLFSMGWTLGETEALPPFLAVWSPSIIALMVALLLLKGLNRTAALDPYLAVKRFWNRFKHLQNNGQKTNLDLTSPLYDDTITPEERLFGPNNEEKSSEEKKS